jgi:hypothetical protein
VGNQAESQKSSKFPAIQDHQYGQLPMGAPAATKRDMERHYILDYVSERQTVGVTGPKGIAPPLQ